MVSVEGKKYEMHFNKVFFQSHKNCLIIIINFVSVRGENLNFVEKSRVKYKVTTQSIT